MNRSEELRWNNIGKLFYCPTSKMVWQYDHTGKIHTYVDMPTYGLERKEIKE